jgi:hypothetical protein
MESNIHAEAFDCPPCSRIRGGESSLPEATTKVSPSRVGKRSSVFGVSQPSRTSR